MFETANMKQAALWYASHGIPVFPLHWPEGGACSCKKQDCSSRGKHPLTPRGFKDATKDLSKVTELWNRYPQANIGVPTGAESGLLVVDIDPRDGGDAVWDDIRQPYNSTAEQITGGGGRHILFRDHGKPIPKTLAQGIDLKGNGGYVVVAPSLHMSGKRYQWDGVEDADALLHPAEVPGWLQDQLDRGSRATESAKIPPQNSGRWVPGERNNNLTSLAGTMRRTGMTGDAIEAALLVVNRERCVPPLPDVEVQQIARSIASYDPATVVEWPRLEPFARQSVDAFDPSWYPAFVRDMVTAVAAATETPIELGGLLILPILSSASAGKVEISPEAGYVEPVNLYAVAAMESGNRKTAVLRQLTAPVLDYEVELARTSAPERQRLASERKTLEMRIERLRKHAADAVDASKRATAMAEIRELEENLPEPQPAPRLLVDDITPEKLAVTMADQGERIGMFSDEGGIFDVLAGRYSKGVPNLDLFLKAHSGSHVRVDRSGKPNPVILNRPLLSIGLSPQPDVLRGLKGVPGFRGRGLLARFLYSLPVSRLGNRTLIPTPVPPAVADAYTVGIRQLFQFKPSETIGLTLSADAHREWKEFQGGVEIQFREGGLLEDLKDWGSKLPGAAARIAANFHMALHAGNPRFPTEITTETMRGAIELATSLISHTRATFNLMDGDTAIERAHTILKWAIKRGVPRFIVRECFRAHQNRFERMEPMLAAIKVLEDRGYLRRIRLHSTGGRPSDTCELNPLVLSGEER